MASKAPWRSTYSQRSFGSLSRAKLQKPQLALQALLSANSQRPGPPELATSRSVSQTRERGFASAPLSVIESRADSGRGSCMGAMLALIEGF